LTQGTGRGICR